MDLKSLKAPIYIFVSFKQPRGTEGSDYKNEKNFTTPQHSLMSFNSCFTSFNTQAEYLLSVDGCCNT